MAEDSDPTETEDPTQKRLDDAHEKGDVAKSQEVNTWFVIIGRHAGAVDVFGLDRLRASWRRCAA